MVLCGEVLLRQLHQSAVVVSFHLLVTITSVVLDGEIVLDGLACASERVCFGDWGEGFQSLTLIKCTRMLGSQLERVDRGLQIRNANRYGSSQGRVCARPLGRGLASNRLLVAARPAPLGMAESKSWNLVVSFDAWGRWARWCLAVKSFFDMSISLLGWYFLIMLRYRRWPTPTPNYWR